MISNNVWVKRWITNAVVVFLLATSVSLAGAKVRADASVLLGQKDFNDGEGVVFVSYASASTGEPAPFDAFRGSDFDAPFSASWTFNYAAGTYGSAVIAFGITDHDSQAPGNQVAFFGVDGNDLTSLLNTQFESHGGRQAEYNVYSLAVPIAALGDLNDGSATFTLTLQGPGLSGLRLTDTPDLVPNNGAGLDFSRLDLFVPEPASSVSICIAIAGMFAVGRRR